MDKLFDLINIITHLPTVSGFEYMSNKVVLSTVKEYTKDFFDSSEILPTGSVLLIHKSKGKNAKKLMFDAHIDTVGFCVTQHLENGFVKVCAVGGVSGDILPSCEILLHGKEDVRAFFTSTPPHLSKDSEKPKKMIDALCVDTGLEDKELEKILPIGTCGTFFAPTVRLLNDRIASPYLDDKICIAAICQCCKNLAKNPPQNTDIYVLLSAGEEKSQIGARTVASRVLPDACIVLDVNFAKEKGSKQTEYIPMDKGPGISISSCTHRAFTDFIYDTANKHGISCSRIVEMTNTGTNAQVIARTGTGIPTAVLSIPLKYMHSSVECASLCDVQKTADLLYQVAHEVDSFEDGHEKYFVKGGKCIE